MERDDVVQALYDHALVTALTSFDGSIKLSGVQLAMALATGDDEGVAELRTRIKQLVR